VIVPYSTIFNSGPAVWNGTALPQIPPISAMPLDAAAASLMYQYYGSSELWRWVRLGPGVASPGQFAAEANAEPPSKKANAKAKASAGH